METLLVKIFATALALSQVTTAPEAVKTRFDRTQDQQQAAQVLRAGCTHMRKAFDIEDINLEELIATALDDPQAMEESKAFRGINFVDLQTAHRQFCKNEVGRRKRHGGSAMADRDINIGRTINVTGMIGVSAGIILFTIGMVLLLFRRGFGFDIPNAFHWFW
jgi:hypothetical protein